MQNWFKDWFGSDLYLKVYEHRNDDDAKRICDLIIEKTNLKANSKILDGACGAGRHSIYLSKLGHEVFAFDLSKTLLHIAYTKALEEKENVHFVCSDIRYPAFNGQFHLIVNLFTSFGYFNSIEENFLFIKWAYQNLKSGGYYVLDYFNEKYIQSNLVAKSVKNVNDFEIVEQRKIENERVIKTITIKSDKENTFFESVALYSKDEIEKELKKIGFKNINYFGDYYGSEFQKENSPRLIFIVQK